jgi:hypothetical protein
MEYNTQDIEEFGYDDFKERGDLQILRDAIDRNKMVSVAFVKKDGAVRHMLIRKNLSSYVPSEREKTDAQMNVEKNHDLKKVIDINSYKKELKRLRNENPEMDSNEMKSMASKGAWRSISLKNVLGFMVSGQFIDLREENEIMERYGEEVHNSLTKSMVNAMNQEVQQEPDIQDVEPNGDPMVNEQVNRIKSLMWLMK